LSYNYIALQQLTQQTVEQEGARYVILLDKEGKVAGHSGGSEWQGKELQDPVSREAAASPTTLVQSVKSSNLGRHPGLDITIPVYVEGSPQKWGTVRVGISLDPMHQRLASIQLWGIGLGVGVLLLALIVAQLLARHITRPLHRLVEATGELARGNFDIRIDLTTGDEMEDLSKQFEVMAGEIRVRQQQVEATNHDLARLNAGLEEEVRKRTHALLEAEQKYRILVEYSPNPICILQRGRLVFFNRAFQQAFGYGAEELQRPGFDFLSLLEPEDRGKVEALLGGDGSGPSGADESIEIVAQPKSGTPIHLDMRSTLISYEGSPALEAILVDVTERRKLQEQVVSYERLRALGEMAGGVAHDFNNVLGAILARAQMLQRSAAEPQVLRGLQIIEKAARDGAETVKRIQNFTRVRTEQDFTRVDLNPVLDDVVEMTRSRWEDDAHRQGKRIFVTREWGEIPGVRGNVSELREVFTNLLLNAVDAIHGEGTIRVSTRRNGDKVTVVVADDGEGMPPEVQRRLFDPFFTTKGVQGTGLGMSVAYGITRRHGATIEVESELRKGTVFRLEFPALQDEEAEPMQKPQSEEPLEGNERILVVDDQGEIIDLLEDVLGGAGYTVVKASGGNEALARLEAEPFDLLITDLGMPGMSGWEVVHEARRIRPGIRTLLLTGWAATLDPEEIRRNGVDQTLKKPFEMDEILRMVRDILAPVRVRRAA
jgi:PAS domain S-box-containing protein